MSEGAPSSWEVLEEGTTVFASDGSKVGEVKRVLAVPEEDIFEGIIVKTHDGDRFAHADSIDSIHERGVDLKLDAAAASRLPEPEPAPAVEGLTPDDVSQATGPYKREIWLKRVWNRISGNY